MLREFPDRNKGQSPFIALMSTMAELCSLEDLSDYSTFTNRLRISIDLVSWDIKSNTYSATDIPLLRAALTNARDLVAATPLNSATPFSLGRPRWSPSMGRYCTRYGEWLVMIRAVSPRFLQKVLVVHVASWNCDQELSIEGPSWDNLPFPCTQVYRRNIEISIPRVPCTPRKPQEQPLRLDAVTRFQQFLQQPGPQMCSPFQQLKCTEDLLLGFDGGCQLKECTLWCSVSYGPIPCPERNLHYSHRAI